MAEVASAYVSLLPSFRGGAAAISRELDGPAKKAGQDGGKAYGTGMAAGIGGMAKRIFAPLAAAAGGVAIGSFFKGALDEASGLNESINALDVSYGDASEGVQALGRSAATNLGLSNLEFNNLAVRFSAFSKTIAGEGGNVVGTLGDLTGRASDFASVMNLDVNEAAQLFQSGLAGETEPLRRFGIDLSAAAVEAYGLEKGLAANGKTLTEQEKVQARYGLLMESTANTQGDFANTSDQLANKQRILSANFADTKARIGAALLPAMSALVSFASGSLLPALEGVGQFISGDLIPGIQSLAEWIMANQKPIAVVAGVIAAVFLPGLIAMGVQATINGAKVVAAWIATQAGAIGAAAVHSVQVVRMVAGWVLMGAQSLIQAARMAAAWLIAMGPVGLVIAAVVGLVALIIANWDTIVAWTKQAWTNVTEWLGKAWENITTAVTTAWNAILDFFKAIPGKVVAFFQNWTLIGLLIKHWDSIKSTAINVWNSIVAWVKGIPGRILANLRAIANIAGDMGRWVLRMKDAAVEKFVALVDYVKGIPGRILAGLGDMGRKLFSAGKDLLQGMIDGIKDKVAGAVTAVKDAVGSVIDGAKNLLGINSPSRVFMEIGAYTGEGFTRGIEKQQNSAAAAMRDLVKPPNVPDMRSNLTLAGGAGAGSSGPPIQQTNYVTNPDPDAVMGVLNARLGSAMAGAR